MEAIVDLPTKKRRILVILANARTKKKWVRRRDLYRIASRGYISRLLIDLLNESLIERKGRPKHYLYRGTERLHKLLNLGQLPRSSLDGLRKEERPRLQEVVIRPIEDYVDAEAMWKESQRVTFRVDSHVGNWIRKHCEAPSRKDNAEQYTYSCSAFTLIISKKNNCVLIMKVPDWQKALTGWLMSMGLVTSDINFILRQVHMQLPGRISRYEMPVFDRTLKRRRAEFVVKTQVRDEFIVSNINYSTDVDLEVYGHDFLVDVWLSVLAGTQHNQVVALAALQKQIAELTRKINELEAKSKKKREDGMYV